MAVKRRKATTTRRSAKRSYKRSKKAALKIKVKPTVAREIWAIFYFVIASLTVLSIQGAFGFLGDLWIGFLSPIIGWGIYILPVVFVMLSGMMFFSKVIDSKLFGLFLFVVSILSVLHLSVPIESIRDYAALGQYGGYTVTNFLLLNFRCWKSGGNNYFLEYFCHQ